MKKSLVFMFSGQGSQYYYMGQELYEKHARFKAWMDHCSEVLQPLIDVSLIDVLYRQEVSKDTAFDSILYTNPAILCIEYCLARVLTEMNLEPDFLLGYSLGELTACVVSGAISLEDGIKVSVDIAKLLAKSTPKAKMLAVIESDAILYKHKNLFQSCWLTGKNFDGNFVVSGLAEDILTLRMALSEMNVVSQILPVNYGFHTNLIDSVETEFKSLIQKISVSNVSIPVISSVDVKEIIDVDEQYLWRVIRHPVEFKKTIDNLLKRGEHTFIDVGPSGSLATFVKYILPADSKSTHLETINPFGKDLISLDKLLLAAV